MDKTYKLVLTDETPILGEIRYRLPDRALPLVVPIIWSGKEWLPLLEPEKDQPHGYRKWGNG